jgi:hypothetical protein
MYASTLDEVRSGICTGALLHAGGAPRGGENYLEFRRLSSPANAAVPAYLST